MGKNAESAKRVGFKKFATPRIIGGIAIAVVILWALTVIFSSSESPTSESAIEKQYEKTMAVETHPPADQIGETNTTHPPAAETADHQGTTATGGGASQTGAAGETGSAPADQAIVQEQPPTAPGQAEQKGAHEAAAEKAQPAPAPAAHTTKPAPRGVAFVEATIKPMQYELEERWWGWRPNDLIDITDNVNNYQMGVLEVTRRTTVALAERISRTGTTDSFDRNLEQAMNWFMIKATSYWFPSAETKYREGLDDLQAYLDKLEAGRATFYTRTDNLIPLLASFEDLLGSCDENLVKQVDEDGSPVDFFLVDDYFYYAKGVSSSMATVLEAVHHDFLLTLESRNATELLHHAIVSCQQAADLDPWIILDRNLSSIFANHRANMAAPISHARFYLGQLIKTLST